MESDISALKQKLHVSTFNRADKLFAKLDISSNAICVSSDGEASTSEVLSSTSSSTADNLSQPTPESSVTPTAARPGLESLRFTPEMLDRARAGLNTVLKAERAASSCLAPSLAATAPALCSALASLTLTASASSSDLDAADASTARVAAALGLVAPYLHPLLASAHQNVDTIDTIDNNTQSAALLQHDFSELLSSLSFDLVALLCAVTETYPKQLHDAYAAESGSNVSFYGPSLNSNTNSMSSSYSNIPSVTDNSADPDRSINGVPAQLYSFLTSSAPASSAASADAAAAAAAVATALAQPHLLTVTPAQLAPASLGPGPAAAGAAAVTPLTHYAALTPERLSTSSNVSVPGSANVSQQKRQQHQLQEKEHCEYLCRGLSQQEQQSAIAQHIALSSTLTNSKSAAAAFTAAANNAAPAASTTCHTANGGSLMAPAAAAVEAGPAVLTLAASVDAFKLALRSLAKAAVAVINNSNSDNTTTADSRAAAVRVVAVIAAWLCDTAVLERFLYNSSLEAARAALLNALFSYVVADAAARGHRWRLNCVLAAPTVNRDVDTDACDPLNVRWAWLLQRACVRLCCDAPALSLPGSQTHSSTQSLVPSVALRHCAAHAAECARTAMATATDAAAALTVGALRHFTPFVSALAAALTRTATTTNTTASPESTVFNSSSSKNVSPGPWSGGYVFPTQSPSSSTETGSDGVHAGARVPAASPFAAYLLLQALHGLPPTAATVAACLRAVTLPQSPATAGAAGVTDAVVTTSLIDTACDRVTAALAAISNPLPFKARAELVFFTFVASLPQRPVGARRPASDFSHSYPRVFQSKYHNSDITRPALLCWLPDEVKLHMYRTLSKYPPASPSQVSTSLKPNNATRARVSVLAMLNWARALYSSQVALSPSLLAFNFAHTNTTSAQTKTTSCATSGTGTGKAVAATAAVAVAVRKRRCVHENMKRTAFTIGVSAAITAATATPETHANSNASAISTRDYDKSTNALATKLGVVFAAPADGLAVPASLVVTATTYAKSPKNRSGNSNSNKLSSIYAEGDNDCSEDDDDYDAAKIKSPHESSRPAHALPAAWACAAAIVTGALDAFVRTTAAAAQRHQNNAGYGQSSAAVSAWASLVATTSAVVKTGAEATAAQRARVRETEDAAAKARAARGGSSESAMGLKERDEAAWNKWVADTVMKQSATIDAAADAERARARTAFTEQRERDHAAAAEARAAAAALKQNSSDESADSGGQNDVSGQQQGTPVFRYEDEYMEVEIRERPLTPECDSDADGDSKSNTHLKRSVGEGSVCREATRSNKAAEAKAPEAKSTDAADADAEQVAGVEAGVDCELLLRIMASAETEARETGEWDVATAIAQGDKDI